MTSWRHMVGLDLDRPDWLEIIRRAESCVPLGRLGRYELLEEIGRGGQGIVYRARHGERVVALKRLLAGGLASASVRRRFERETDAVRALRHPGVVHVLDVEEVDGQPLLVMEWIDGRAITEWAVGRSVPEIVEVVCRAGEALLHAHQRGVIHRDLKPSNVLVDAAGNPHVLDFGLAKMRGLDAGTTMTTSGQFLGTLAYASPEHVLASSEAVDARSDLYALGVIFYQMLTGAMPYPLGENAPAAIHAVTAVEPTRPRSLAPRVDRSLEGILLQALAKRPADRYQSVDAFVNDLRRHQRGEPVEAKGPSAWHAASRVVKRHPTASSIAGALGLLVLTFAATMALLYHRSELASLRADRARTALEATLLSSPSPISRWDDDAVLEELAHTVSRLDTDLAGEPELELRLRNHVAHRYALLGMWSLVGENAQRAMELAEQLHAVRTSDHAWSLHLAGLAAMAEGAIDTSDAYLARSIEIYTERHGEVHPLVADAMVSRAYLDWAGREQPDYEAATRRYEAALGLFARSESPSPQLHARALERFGQMLRASGDCAGAAERYRAALTQYESMESPPVRRLTSCYQNLADALRMSDHPEQSVAAYRRAIELRGGQIDYFLPPAHANLGNALFRQGHYRDALSSYHDAIIARCHRLSLRMPEHRREFLHHAALIENGLDPDEVDGLWQSLRDAAPGIIPLFRFTAGRIAETWRRLGDDSRALALERRIAANEALDQAPSARVSQGSS